MCEGWLWVSESATLKTVEDMVTFCPKWVSRRVSITSGVENRKAKMDYRIDKMTEGEKDSVKLRHGDVIHFAFDRHFGLVPNEKDSIQRSAPVSLNNTGELIARSLNAILG